MIPPLLSVVLGTYNRLRFLKHTIDSIRRELDLSQFPREIIVVDGGSSDGTLKWLSRQKDIITIIQHNRGQWRGKSIERRPWGYFMNLGFKCSHGEYVCMLSDDCLVVPGAIKNGVDLFRKRLAAGDKVGAVAFYWRNWPEQEKYRVGLTLGNRMFVNHGLYLNEAMKQVGYCDEEMYSFYHADGDLCLKMWEQGYSCIDAPDSYIEHYSHANLAIRKSNSNKQQQDWTNYLNRWKGIFYHTEINDIGDWVEKTFIDPALTVEKFKDAENSKLLKKIKLFTHATLIKARIKDKIC